MTTPQRAAVADQADAFAPHMTNAVQLYGRDEERARLSRLLESASGGVGSALVVRGEAGIGKSALLACFETHCSDALLLRAHGIEGETALAFAGLHQLLGRWIPEHCRRSPAPQRDALERAFGLEEGRPPERLLIATAVMSLLAHLGAEQTVVCLIDDAQWLDAESIEALGFVARRLTTERVAMVFAVREPEGQRLLADLPQLLISGLRHDDARHLLASAVPGQIDSQVCDRIVAESNGNPRALITVPRGLTLGELAGGFGQPSRRVTSCSLEASFQRRVQALPDEPQQVLLVAAAEGIGDTTIVMDAVARLGIDPDAVALAESAGLIEFGINVRFPHPLVRSAAYRGASIEDRRRVHGALAAATDPSSNPDRRAWHLAHAAASPDEAVAAKLEKSAARALARGATAAAAAFLERAAELTPEPAGRGNRTLAAACAGFQAGGPEAVNKLLIAADIYPLTDLDRARLDRLIAHVAVARTRSCDAAASLSAAATGLERFDPALARETHLEAIWAGVRTGRFTDVRPIVDAAARCPAQSDGDSERATDLLFDALVLTVRVGAAPAHAAMARATNEFCRAIATAELANENVTAFSVAAHFALELWDQRSFSTLAHEVTAIARRRGALVTLPCALHYAALAFLLRGDLPRAKESVEEAEAIAGATQNQPDSDFSVLVAAWRGDQSTTSRLRARILEQAAAHRADLAVEVAEWAAAVLHNGAGEYAAARAAACRAFDAGRLGYSGWVLPELVEAAVRSGDRRLAEEAMEQLAQRTQLGDSALARGIEARSRALLADDDAAEALYLRAIEELGQSDIPLCHARAMLVYGEWLRRAHRRVDARAQLRSALEEFERIDAQGFAERTRRELIATGEKARKRTVETRDDLTPAETYIARLATEGLSNPEIGKRLFLSHRTVEWHLRKVFVKLGVDSRRDLAQALQMADDAVAA